MGASIPISRNKIQNWAPADDVGIVSQHPEKKPKRMLKITVPATLRMLRVQKIKMAQAKVQSMTMLKIPNRCTIRLGTTLPTALAPFTIAIWVNSEEKILALRVSLHTV